MPVSLSLTGKGERRIAMNKAEFVYRVQEMTQLPTPEITEEAVMVVLSLLSHRLTQEESRDVAAQLPKDLKNLWNSDTWITSFLSISQQKQLKYRKKEELYALIRNEIDKRQLPVGAEQLATAVFHTLKDQISDGEVLDIGAQLPEDLKLIWLAA